MVSGVEASYLLLPLAYAGFNLSLPYPSLSPFSLFPFHLILLASIQPATSHGERVISSQQVWAEHGQTNILLLQFEVKVTYPVIRTVTDVCCC